ncbi:MAG TPA: O-antigen ligase family protein [Candidatus Saccharimonadales bacterium]|nr:O-antigen ligase family protein [Candidatus Saccharimonadales bacterium]
MTRSRILELACLAVAAAVWVYVGWDSALWDARFQLGLHVAAAAAIVGMAGLALLGHKLPRTAIDLPIVLLLLAFGVASLSAWNPGLSAQALSGIVATAAMLPVALLALRHRPAWTGLVVALPIIGLSLGALVVMIGRRVAWVVAGGPGLPPIRMEHEGTPFGSVAVPPFVILAAIPVVLQVPNQRLRRALLAGLAIVGVPLTLLSGSRSAWVAMAVAVVVLGAPVLRRVGRPWRWRARDFALAAGGLLVAAAGLLVVGRRLLEASSLVYRSDLWRDTLTAWSVNPLLGIGPGSMPYAREAAAPPLSIPVAQPHSHNVLLGILGDAGILGLLAALAVMVVFVWVAGPWRLRTFAGRAAFAILAGFSVGMLFEDLTFLPNFNLLILLLVATCLTDAGAVTWRPIRLPRLAWAVVAAGALALGSVLLVGDASAIAYRGGIDAAGAGDWATAQARLMTSVRLNPWQPTGPKSLAVAADYNGQPALARASAMRAVSLNPGDGASWTNLALLCLDAGDVSCARSAADHGVAKTTAPALALINAAQIYERLGDRTAADAAYRLSLLTNWWTGLTVRWVRPVAVGQEDVTELAGETAEMNLVIARRIEGVDLAVASYQYPLARALALAMSGDRGSSRAALTEAIAAEPASTLVWQIAALLQRHWGEDDAHALRMIEVASGVRSGPAPPRRGVPLLQDIATFRAYPGDSLVAGAQRLPPSGWPWVLDPLLAP